MTGPTGSHHVARAWQKCDCVWTGTVAERRDTSAEVFSHRFPAASDVESGRRELDDRQVAHGIPVWSGGHAGAQSRMGQSSVLRLALGRAIEHRSDGCPGLAMFYLLLIIIFLTVLLRLSKRWTQKVA